MVAELATGAAPSLFPPVVVAIVTCPRHAQERNHERRARTNHSHLHGSKRWQRERSTFLAKPENRWCRYRQEGRQTASECVDREQAAKGNAPVFWDRSRWVPSCLRHNTLKGIALEGGFGRRSSRQPRTTRADEAPTWV
jgi:hypothetical protein